MLDCDLQENMQGGSGVVITIGRKYGSGGKEIGQRLAQRVLAITKCDLIDKDIEKEIEPSLPKGIPHVFISSVSGEGIKDLKDMLWSALHS